MSNMQFDVKIRKLADEPERGKLDFQRDEWEAVRLSRVHEMQTRSGSCRPPSFLAGERGPFIYLFKGKKWEFRGSGVYYQNGWIPHRAVMCSKWNHIIKYHRRLLTQFPPYWNKTGIIPSGPTWLFFCCCSSFGRISVSGRQGKWKQIWGKQRYTGRTNIRQIFMWWGMENA